MDAYHYTAGTIPLLLSIPHAGTRLTEEVARGLCDCASPLPDTDWHVPVLYQFAREMGAHIICANYSRMVVDLNRPADDAPLYSTATTGLFPNTLFDGSAVFKQGMSPTAQQHEHYLTHIWQPYHAQIRRTLAQIKSEFGYALLFDAHSSASHIPRLFDGQLPDLNLGTNGGLSVSATISDALAACCQAQNHFSWVMNGRFKGGFITREYGKPEHNVFALQLELAQKNYMDECAPFPYRPDKAETLIAMLQNIMTTFLNSAQNELAPTSRP